MARALQSQCPSNRHHVDSSPFVLSFVFLCTVLSQCTGSVICPNIGHYGCLVVMDAKGARDRTGITHRELNCQEKQECYCYFSMMKVFLLESSVPSRKQSQCGAPFRDSVYGARADLGLMFAQEYRNPELRHSWFQPKLQWKVALWDYLQFCLNATSFFSIFNISLE